MSGMSAATSSAQTIAPPAPPLSHLPCCEGGTTGLASSATSSFSTLFMRAALTAVTPSCQVVGVYAMPPILARRPDYLGSGGEGVSSPDCAGEGVSVATCGAEGVST